MLRLPQVVGGCSANQLLADPNSVQVGVCTHHAIDDGMGFANALGGKLLHVLIDL